MGADVRRELLGLCRVSRLEHGLDGCVQLVERRALVGDLVGELAQLLQDVRFQAAFLETPTRRAIPRPNSATDLTRSSILLALFDASIPSMVSRRMPNPNSSSATPQRNSLSLFFVSSSMPTVSRWEAASQLRSDS